VIHAAVYAGRANGWEDFGIREGYDGLLDPDHYPEGGLVPLERAAVRHIAHLGGTILGTTNRGNPFTHVVTRPDGTREEQDRSEYVPLRQAVAKMKTVPLDSDGIVTARTLDISLGD